MGWWTKAIREPAESWFFTRIGTDTPPPVEPETTYIHAFLRSMRLADSRIGSITYRGSAMSTSRWDCSRYRSPTSSSRI
ncbi:hypothetical protein [Kibdelosporangium aridum]|uniref:Uncharacterized protein n=1 Tax=Kibdelosporangium aridum TaxID=2030 RepID=A0A1Y5X189_KIBAR|nr:hypothetical protein [Kibdelosporangium aridum]SMC64431.1 hypothetical protein SAMN05661093_01131 [Kibdelosporangium aridum]